MMWRKENILRIVGDLLLVEIAAIVAVILIYSFIGSGVPEANLSAAIVAHLNYLGLLAIISSPVMYANGVYTHGRTYTKRYKFRNIFLAVTWVYLLVGFAIYGIGIGPAFPWVVLLSGWIVSIILLVGARATDTVRANGLIALFPNTHPELEERSVPTNPQHILVLGGAGYIGSMLVHQLLKQGYRVRVIDKLLFGDTSLADLNDNSNLELIVKDFRHVGVIAKAVQGIDTIIHLAAIVGDPACAIDEELSYQVNLHATKMIAEVAKVNGVRRYIFASTCSVYGAGDNILNEQSALAPLSTYAKTKIDAEKILLRLRDATFAPVILRLATVYGLSYRPRFDLVVNLLAAKATRDRQITIFGGDQWRPFIHVQDVARAMIKVLEAPDVVVSGQTFNVGSDEQNYTISQVGQIIKRLIPEADLIESGGDTDQRNYRVSFAKIRHTLNFGPTTSIEDGVREIQAALKQGQITDYQDEFYSNYKSLQHWYEMPRVDADHVESLALPHHLVQLNGLHMGQGIQIRFVNIRPGQHLRETLSNGNGSPNIYYLFSQQEWPNLQLFLTQNLILIEEGQYEDAIRQLRYLLQRIEDHDLAHLLEQSQLANREYDFS